MQDVHVQGMSSHCFSAEAIYSSFGWSLQNRKLSKAKQRFIQWPSQNGKNVTKNVTYGFWFNLNQGGGGETSARCGKEKCPIKYKIAIMLLHIHTFLLRAYHSMQSTLPCLRGSRGALQQQWEEKTQKKPLWINAMTLFFLDSAFCYFVYKLCEGESYTNLMLKSTSHAAKLKARSLKIWKRSFFTSKNKTLIWKRRNDIYDIVGKGLQADYSCCIMRLYSFLKPLSSSDI